MTIDEAVRVQTDYLTNPFLDFHKDLRESMKLSIEALTLIQMLRAAPGNLSIPLLKGETK